MKNALLIILSSGLTWFVAKWSGDTETSNPVKQEIHVEDTVLTKLSSKQKEIVSAMQGGDKKVVETIDQAAKTITTLKEKVNFLQNTVKNLLNEKDSLIGVIKSNGANGAKFDLLPIAKDNK